MIGCLAAWQDARGESPSHHGQEIQQLRGKEFTMILSDAGAGLSTLVVAKTVKI